MTRSWIGRAFLWIGISCTVGLRAGFAGDVPRPAPPAAKPPPTRTPLEEAIRKGSQGLAALQGKGGIWWEDVTGDDPVPVTPLALLALLGGGLPVDAPPIEAGLAALASQRPMQSTNGAALTMLVLEALGNRRLGLPGDASVDRYGQPIEPRNRLARYSEKEQAWMVECAHFLVASQIPSLEWIGPRVGTPEADRQWRRQTGSGAWASKRTEPTLPTEGVGYPIVVDASLSFTHNAILGLQAAARCGVSVPASTWRGALACLALWEWPGGDAEELRANEVSAGVFREWKERARARGFSPSGCTEGVSATWTAAGAATLAMCLASLPRDSDADAGLVGEGRGALLDALAWMQRRGSAPWRVVGTSGIDPEVFLSVLSMGNATRCRYVGTHDWSAEGTAELLRAQNADGTWGAGGLRGKATAVALIFLTNGLIRSRVSVLGKPGLPAK